LTNVRKREHQCPGGRTTPCPKFVPDRLLSCPDHWFRLPADVRRQIERTANLPLLHPDRRAAIQAALDVWKETAQ
jgi:hypothetical protein